MASPQLENGHTRIANEILDALISANLSGHELRIALLVIRKTYGYQKHIDAISLSQMMMATGLSKVRCSQIINRLQLQKTVTVTENCNGLTKKYKFNKDIDEWCIPLQKSVTVTEKCNKPLQKSVTTKESKENTLSIKREVPLQKSVTPRPHVIPHDFPLTDKLIAYARSKGLNNGRVEIEFEKFKNYFLSSGKKYIDWERAFYSWVMRAADQPQQAKAKDDYYKNWKVQ